ncbi:hypothetical protein [Acidovorax sp. JHL-3]|uniref:hypothetical protein n=1 Tax=Acidovorax sp. JHL-3 TaxID=1276755 RepID=UPI0012DBD002|nr:hypothetical protein [Acidovorax sp. JHL-3]
MNTLSLFTFHGAMLLPGNRSHVVGPLPQAGNGEVICRLQWVMGRGGGWHLRILQVGRYCASHLKPSFEPYQHPKCKINTPLLLIFI